MMTDNQTPTVVEVFSKPLVDPVVEDTLSPEAIKDVIAEEKRAYNILCISLGKKSRKSRIHPLFGARRCGKFLSDEKVLLVLRLLVEGLSQRSISRILSISTNTIGSLIKNYGALARSFLASRMVGIPCSEVEVDEMYTYVFSKHHSSKECSKGEHTQGRGPRWIYFGLDRRTRLLLTYHVGHRTTDDAIVFMNRLRAATSGGMTIYTDGFQPYPTAVYAAFIYDGDKQQIPTERDAPAVIVRNDGRMADLHGFEALDQTRAATNKIERFNGLVRMSLKRMSRATMSFSKSQQALDDTIALFLCYYNFCRPHSGLGNVSPAHFSGLTDKPWTMGDLAFAVNAPQIALAAQAASAASALQRLRKREKEAAALTISPIVSARMERNKSIVDQRLKGVSVNEIARRHGISHQAVRLVLKNPYKWLQPQPIDSRKVRCA